MSLKSIAFRYKHNKKVLILLELYDKKLAIYSDDKIIYIFKRSLSLSYKIKSINSIIKSMIKTKDNEKLICCSYEITILKLFKDHYETLQIIKTWTNKIIEINDELNNNNQIIASQNNFIRVYQLNQDSYLYKLKNEINLGKNVNNFIYVKENDFALILDDYFKHISVDIYDIKTNKFKNKLYEIKVKESGDIFIFNNKYLIVSFYLYLILIGVEGNYKFLHEIKTTFGCVNSFCGINNDSFLTGDDIGDIIEWKIKDNKIKKIKEYNCSKKAINSIKNYNNNNLWIAVGSNDGLINFYETNS